MVLAQVDDNLDRAQRDLGELLTEETPADLKGYADDLWTRLGRVRLELAGRAKSM